MPAYWSMEIEFDKRAASVRKFYDCLAECGVFFLAGFRKSKGFSYEEVLANHEAYFFDSAFKDGPYYQDLFHFNGFSEVRGYWDFKNTALFTIIIPEDDFLFWDRGVSPESKDFRNVDAMKIVKTLALELWKRLDLLTIQTAWECSDVPASFFELYDNGYPPQAEPFAIVKGMINIAGLRTTAIDKNGILIENENNWFYV